jgi:hypothetical protein
VDVSQVRPRPQTIPISEAAGNQTMEWVFLEMIVRLNGMCLAGFVYEEDWGGLSDEYYREWGRGLGENIESIFVWNL